VAAIPLFRLACLTFLYISNTVKEQQFGFRAQHEAVWLAVKTKTTVIEDFLGEVFPAWRQAAVGVSWWTPLAGSADHSTCIRLQTDVDVLSVLVITQSVRILSKRLWRIIRQYWRLRSLPTVVTPFQECVMLFCLIAAPF
jgi:hypothetical protein